MADLSSFRSPGNLTILMLVEGRRHLPRSAEILSRFLAAESTASLSEVYAYTFEIRRGGEYKEEKR